MFWGQGPFSKHDVLPEDVDEYYERLGDGPGAPAFKRPVTAAEIRRNQLISRHYCRCEDCGGPMPHRTSDMMCARCIRQYTADLIAFGLLEAAQGMALSENSRSEVEAEGRQPGPATQDAPNHDILKGDAGQPNKRGATS